MLELSSNVTGTVNGRLDDRTASALNALASRAASSRACRAASERRAYIFMQVRRLLDTAQVLDAGVCRRLQGSDLVPQVWQAPHHQHPRDKPVRERAG
jgi:hypothetical protein